MIIRYKVFLLLWISAMISFYNLSGQVITGRIVNEQDEPVPYATIFIQELKEGTITNAQGKFSLQASAGHYHIVFRSLGYHQVEREVTVNRDTVWLDLVMQPQNFEIKEVLVFPRKEDPAYYIVRKAMANAAYYREKIKHYEADLYIKSNFRFTNIPRLYENRMEIDGRKMKDVLKEGMTYVIESQNKVVYDYPGNYQQEVISKRSSLVGFDEPPVMGLITSSFYDARPNQVISPLSPAALRHYNYSYEGFITSGEFDVFRIKVEPKRKSDELVSGYMYIVDRLWCLYHVNFSTRIKFFGFRIEQQYDNLGNENWLPVSHLIQGDFSMLGLKGDFFYTASLKYSVIEENEGAGPVQAADEMQGEVLGEISEKEAALRKQVAEIVEKEELTNRDVQKAGRLNRKILKEQYKDTSIVSTEAERYKIDDKSDSVIVTREQWDTLRTIPLTPDELRSYQFSDSLKIIVKAQAGSDTTKTVKNSFIKKILTGSPKLISDSTYTIGYDGLLNPSNYGFNTVDGFRVSQRFNIMIRPDSGQVIQLIPEAGYAINRKAFFWNISTRLNGILLKNNSLRFDFGKMSRDFKPEGIGINPFHNSTASWFFGENYMKLYETSFAGISTTQRIKKGFSLQANLDYNDFSPLENNTFYRLSDKKEYSPNIPWGLEEDSRFLMKQKSFTYLISARYRKVQRKPWLENSEFLMISDFYSIGLRYEQGVPGVFSSVADYSHIGLSLNQQANISPGAGIDWQFNAGSFLHVNQLHFSQFKHFRTAEIPIPFQSFTHTFQLLNDYQPSTSGSYLQAGAELRSEYMVLRYLSILNTHTWSESIHLNYLLTPGINNYWEAGYSLNNLFFIGSAGVFAGFNDTSFKNIMFKISIAGF
jgi:hypothetical protein